MRRQKGFDGPAQQGRVVTGHWRYDQHARLRHAQRPRQLAIEIQQPAKRLFPYRADFNRGACAADLGVGDAPFGLAVAARRPFEHFAAGGDGFAELGMRQRIKRVLKQDFCGVSNSSRRVERGVRHFVHPVHRRGKRRTAFGHQRRRAAKLTNRHLILKSFASQHTAECAIKRQCTDRYISAVDKSKTLKFMG